jgi:hypothetical protein
MSDGELDRAAQDSGACPSCTEGGGSGDVVADPSTGDVTTGSYEPPASEPEPPPPPQPDPPPPPEPEAAPAPESSGE